ncbi:MAG: protein kinase family protein [Bacillota bacterium]|nr:protein kinase family protein [Bacillota bacterium]
MNRYVLKQHIQEHANVSVDLVEDQITGKTCIQKSVSKNASPLIIHQFHIEVDILSSLHHPLIPEIMNVYADSRNLFLIESYIPGKDFSYHKRHFSLLFHLQKTKYMLEIIDILQHIHEIGYLYIDLKPRNLLLYKNRVYLIDFNACIPMHSTQAVFASKENISAELYRQEKKDETTDMYFFGKLVQSFFPCSLFFFKRKCLKQDCSKRFSTWKQMKKSFLFYIWSRRIFCVFFIIISVFFAEETLFKTEVNNLQIYFKEPNVTTFFNAYQETLSQFQGTTIDKIQMNLYKWIHNDWIQEDLWDDVLVSKYLLIQSIQSKNPVLCHNVIQNMKRTEDVERYLMLASYIENPELVLKKESVDAFLQEMERGDIKILIPILLGSQFEINKEQEEILNTLFQEEKEAFTCQEACILLEYNLFLKSIQSKHSLDLELFDEVYGKEKEWSDLYEIYRRTK